jgi:K(+)-stimulated pyrophosphate-energized sodium pump
MYSTITPALIVASVILATFALSGSVYGIALASTGLLSTLGITLATDAYGPVADNAGGIAESNYITN